MVAHDFARLGVPIIRRENNEIGVAGLESLIPKYSKRTNHIEDVARQLNITDADEKDGLGAKTRKKKDKLLSPDQLRAEWDAQLSPEEREALQRLWRIIGGGEAADAARPAVTAREAVEFAIDHCSDKLAVIPERDLMKTALLHGLGSVTPDMIDREMHDPRHGLIFDVKDGERVVTTERLQDEEWELAATAADGLGRVMPVSFSPQIDRQLAGGKKLSDEQYQAVTDLLASPNRINLVQGPAGAGKSSLLRKYDEGVRHAGENVTYLATTAKAAEVLQKDGFADTRTVASFLMSDKAQQAAAQGGGRVVVDETSMLGHKEARRLLAIGRKNNLKFVFVGDPMQHGSVGRGAFMRLLMEKGNIQPVRLTKILRQKDPAYRAAAQMFSEGRAVEGFDALNRMGWVLELADPAERIRRIAGDYVDSLRDVHHWQDVLVVAPTHAEAGAITRRNPRAAQGGREAGRGTRVHPAGPGRYLRGRARPGVYLPPGRRARVPPERQGRLHQGRPDRRHRPGQGAASPRRASLPSTASRRFRSRSVT